MKKSISIIDKRAENRWDKSNISYKNYQAYIEKKEDRFELTFIDLLYISNFKGGNATINEEEKVINEKLKEYSVKLSLIDKKFKNNSLRDLTNNRVKELIKLVLETFELRNNEETRIDGFSYSYLSALLHTHFPNLLPILDRRVLINLKLVHSTNQDKQGQIKKIENFYEKLIYKFAEISKGNGKSIREIDKDEFVKKSEIIS